MADMGCGIGYFTIPASKIIGNNGKILFINILPEIIQDIEVKIRQNRISNIKG